MVRFRTKKSFLKTEEELEMEKDVESIQHFAQSAEKLKSWWERRKKKRSKDE